MFICNKSTEGLFNIEEFLASYSQKSSEKTENEDEKLTFLTMDLFESSDVVDLIGGFEMKASNDDENQNLFEYNSTGKAH